MILAPANGASVLPVPVEVPIPVRASLGSRSAGIVEQAGRVLGNGVPEPVQGHVTGEAVEHSSQGSLHVTIQLGFSNPLRLKIVLLSRISDRPCGANGLFQGASRRFFPAVGRSASGNGLNRPQTLAAKPFLHIEVRLSSTVVNLMMSTQPSRSSVRHVFFPHRRGEPREVSSETSDHFMLSIRKQAVDTHTEAHRGSPMVPLEGAYSPPDDLEEVRDPEASGLHDHDRGGSD